MSKQRFLVLQQALSFYFSQYKIELEERVVPAKVLRLKEGNSFKLIPVTNSKQREIEEGGSGLRIKAMPLGTVAAFIGGRILRPVLDETGVSGQFDLELAWYPENPKQIHEELARLGLVDAERPVKLLVIRDK